MAEELTEAERARVAAATELRRGMHLLVAREPSTDELHQLTTDLSRLFGTLEQTPERRRGTMPFKGADALSPPGDGEAFADSVDRPVSGSGNPFSIPMTMFRDGDAVVCTLVLADGFEGAPGRSHGGFVSAIFDDLFGSLPMLEGKIAFTASLTVNYVAPSPIREPVTYRGWIDRTEGKKIFVVGEAHHGETLVTTASGLFIDATQVMAGLYGA